MYIPTPPAERGVGTNSNYICKLYPANEGLKSAKSAFLIFFSVTPIVLKGKSSSFNRWVWKSSKFRFRLLILLWIKENVFGSERWHLSDLSWLKLCGESPDSPHGFNSDRAVLAIRVAWSNNNNAGVWGWVENNDAVPSAIPTQTRSSRSPMDPPPRCSMGCKTWLDPRSVWGCFFYAQKTTDSARIQTWNLPIRSQATYPDRAQSQHTRAHNLEPRSPTARWKRDLTFQRQTEWDLVSKLTRTHTNTVLNYLLFKHNHA